MSKQRWYITLSTMFLFISSVIIWGTWLTLENASNPSPLPTLAELSDTHSESVIESVPTDDVIETTHDSASEVNLSNPIVQIDFHTIDTLQEPVQNQYVIEFSDEYDADQLSAYMDTLDIEVVDTLTQLNRVVVIADTNTIEQLLSNAIVSTEPDYYASALLNLPPSDPYYEYQWNLEMIAAPSAWVELPTVIAPLRVAVIDSGVCLNHPDMQGAYTTFQYDYVDDDDIPQDSFGHGCSVAGVIASQNNELGIMGIAPFVEIMPLRVLDANGIGTYSNISQAIVDATNQGAQIINLSLGGNNDSSTLQSAIDYALANEVFVVAATGNNGQSTPLYPATYEGVIAVGSVNSEGAISSFSNRGEDSLAPGEEILAPYLNGSYMYMSGTSLAAPHVTGVIALELALGRDPVIDGGIIRVTTIDIPTEEPTPDATETLEFVTKDGRTIPYIEQSPPVKTDRWAVHLQSNIDADNLATQLGFRNIGQVGELQDYYVFIQEGTGTSEALALSAGQALSASPLILEFEQEIALNRDLRAIPTDPLVNEQWHLINTGQSNGTAGYDINVTGAWNDGYDGSGVTIAIVDDGLEITHPDLASNYVPSASYDFNGTDTNPSHESIYDGHGTSVAGVVAADDDGTQCGVGVAYNANLSSLRLLGYGYTKTDSLEAGAFNYAMQTNDIYSNSWGPFDTGYILEGPGSLASAALENGVLNGRGGKGVVYVWAGGNGAEVFDHSNADGYANSRYTIAVGATDDNGKKAVYSESGTNLLVNAPADPTSTLDPTNDPAGIVTTDRSGTDGYNNVMGFSNNCTDNFGGTSSAAPTVAGVVALMLDANPNLTWRDVQHILVESSFKNDPTDTSWNANSAGYDYSMDYGFGTVDATAAVNLAKTWTNVSAATTSVGTTVSTVKAIPDTSVPEFFHHIQTENVKIESVELTWDASHSYRGDFYFVLISPSGTISPIYLPRPGDSNSGSFNWTATSMEFWGEESAGVWTLAVLDYYAGDSGTLNSFSIKFNGTPAPVWDGSLRVGSIEAFRYAIEQVNLSGAHDSITLNPWQEYVFENEYDFSGSTIALPALNTKLTINGNGTTVRRFDSGNHYRFMRILPGGELILNDINLSDFRGWNVSPIDRSGGVIYSNGGILTINNSSLSGNSQEDGGAIYAANTWLTVVSSTITGDGDNGGAIYITSNVSGSIEDSTIMGTANQGGAIYNNAFLTLDNVKVRDSEAGYGAGIYNSGWLEIENGEIYNNSSSNGGGIYNGFGSDLYLNSTDIHNNIASDKGGAIYIDPDSDMKIYESNIYSNKVDAAGGSFSPDSGGGAVWMKGSNLGSTIVNITATLFENNISINKYGGAFYIGDDSSLSLTSVDFTNNSSTNAGGAIYNFGGIITGFSVEFIGNSASDGGAIYVKSQGGFQDKVDLFRVLFNQNYTTTGHGGAVHTYDGGGISIVNGTLTNNSAYGHGGAIYFRSNGNVNLQFVTITENIADSSDTGLYDGGGLYNYYTSSSPTLYARNAIVANNVDKSASPNNYPDCVNRIELVGDNIIEDLTGCTLAGSGANTSGVDPELGTLQFNGGYFDTHTLSLTSPARDAVTDCTYQLISDPTNYTLTSDIRFIFRPQGVACDIGAFELTTDFPADPTGLTTAAVTYNAVQLDWTDNASTESAFVIERSLVGQNTWTEIKRVSANITTYTDTTLVCDGSFDYRVFAFRAGDNRYSENPTATVLGSSWLCPPDQPTNVTASTVLYQEALGVNWQDSNDDESEFRIFRSSSITGTFDLTGTTGVDITTFNDTTGLQCYTEYFYQVQVYRAIDGQTSPLSDIASGQTSCTQVYAPDTLTTDGTEDVMDLTWNDKSPDETSFEIQRSISGAGSWSVMSSVSASITMYTDTTTACGSAYDYKVRAYRDGDTNYSLFSNVSNATQVCAPPPDPSGLTLTALPFTNDIQLDWIDNSNTETDFYIERSTDGLSNWIQVGTVTENIVTYTDTDASLSCYTPYYYQVRAYRSDDGVVSGYSNSISILTWCNPDLIADASNPFTVNTTTSDISGVIGFPQPSCASNMNHAYVWEFPIVSPETLNLTTFGSSIDTMLSILSFDGTTYTEVACNDDSALDGTSALVGNLSSSTRHIVIAGGKNNAGGNITLNSEKIAPPTLTPVPTDTPIPTATTESPNLTTVGVFKDGTWLFRDSNSTGTADISIRFGTTMGDDWIPLVGDWNGDGTDGIGLYKNGRWFLRDMAEGNSNADYVFIFGENEAGWQAVVGDWDGDGIDGIGLYKDGIWMLKNNPSNGDADYAFRFNTSGSTDAIAIAGDWHDESTDRVGLYNNGTWFLSYSHRTNTDARIFQFGPTDGTWLPIVGDWDEDGDDTIGVYKDSAWRLRNTNSRGNTDLGLSFGLEGAVPIAGYRGNAGVLALFASVPDFSESTAIPTLTPTNDSDEVITATVVSTDESDEAVPTTEVATESIVDSTNTATSTITPTLTETSTLVPTLTPTVTWTPIPTLTPTPTEELPTIPDNTSGT